MKCVVLRIVICQYIDNNTDFYIWTFTIDKPRNSAINVFKTCCYMFRLPVVAETCSSLYRYLGSKIVYLLIFCFPVTPCHSAFGGLGVSALAFGTQVRGFKPGRSRRIFQGEKILSAPSFGREVKPWVPCR
jgi:hypothetical protein